MHKCGHDSPSALARAMRGRLMLVTATVGVVTSSLAGSVSIEETTWRSHDAVVLDNGLVRATVTPGYGGHIAAYVLEATGHNFLFGEPSPWAGYTDVLDSKWPGPEIQRRPYACSRQVTEGSASVVCALSFGGIRLVRTMTLRERSASLDVHVELTNQTQEVRTLLYGAHLSAKAGEYCEFARDSIYAWDPGAGLFVRDGTEIPYPLAKEYPSPPRWLALVDRVSSEGILIEYPKDGHHSFLVWKAQKTQIPQAYWTFPDVKPGGRRSIPMRLSLFRGLVELHGTSRSTVVQMATDRSVYGQNDEIRITATLCGLTPLPSCQAILTLRCEDDESETGASVREVPATEPCAPVTLHAAFKTGRAPDGPYRIEFTLRAADDSTIVECSRGISIDGKLINPIRTALSRWHKTLSGLATQAERSPEGAFRQKVQHHRARWLFEDVEKWYATGEYQKAQAGLAELERSCRDLRGR